MHACADLTRNVACLLGCRILELRRNGAACEDSFGYGEIGLASAFAPGLLGALIGHQHGIPVARFAAGHEIGHAQEYHDADDEHQRNMMPSGHIHVVGVPKNAETLACRRKTMTAGRTESHEESVGERLKGTAANKR